MGVSGAARREGGVGIGGSGRGRVVWLAGGGGSRRGRGSRRRRCGGGWGEANGSITGNFHIWLIIKLMMKGYFKICRIAQANRPV